MCERGLDEVVGIARDGVADVLTSRVWTAEINAGSGLRQVPASFTATR